MSRQPLALAPPPSATTPAAPGARRAPVAPAQPAAPAVPAPAPASREGWRAHLRLRFEDAGGTTRLTQRRHEGPLLVQRTFHPEPGVDSGAARDPCHAYLIHPPGGVVGGDQLLLEVTVAPDAHALLTTPAAGKFYRRGAADAPGAAGAAGAAGSAGIARLTQVLTVQGRLEWLPQENIFFPDSAAQLRTVVQLSGAGRFFGWEIGCVGLPAIDAGLGQGELRLGFELHRDGRPLLLERQCIGAECLQAPWGLRGHAAFGSCLAYPVPAAVLERMHARAGELAARFADADLTLACTLVDEVLCCRGFAHRADRLRAALALFWGTLRPLLFGREAVPPRIWAT